MIYSYLPIIDLINKISKLNNEERELLISGNCILDQKRVLKVLFQDGIDIKFHQLKYCIKLSTAV
jgi:hypothetical protein